MNSITEPLSFIIKHNSIEHRALSMLAKENLASSTLSARLKGGYGKGAAGRTTFYNMARAGLIQSVGYDHWQITDHGLDTYHALGGVVDRASRKSAEKSELYKRPNYVPEELKDTMIRPGANDHRDHPSILGNERVWYGLGWRRVKVELIDRP